MGIAIEFSPRDVLAEAGRLADRSEEVRESSGTPRRASDCKARALQARPGEVLAGLLSTKISLENSRTNGGAMDS